MARIGPESLTEFEDRLLYHLVDLTGHGPADLDTAVSEADLAVRLAGELAITPDFPRSEGFFASPAHRKIIAGMKALESGGLVQIKAWAGSPWQIWPKLVGRRKVTSWQQAWQQQQRVLDRRTPRRPAAEVAMTPITQKQAQRFQFLHKLYEVTDGDKFADINMFELGTSLGYSRELTSSLVQYLEGEGLIEGNSFGGGISISHRGVVEVEQALTKPEIPTDHFPAHVVNVYGNMIGSQIQQASPGASQVLQSAEAQQVRVRELVRLIESSLDQLGLDQEASAEIRSDLGSIKAQLDSPKPKFPIIALSLGSIRGVLEGATGHVVAHEIIAKILPLLGA